MLKLKLMVIVGVLSFVGIVFLNSNSFTSSAKGDAIEEIAKYKTWTKVSKEPIIVKIDEAALVGG